MAVVARICLSIFVVAFALFAALPARAAEPQFPQLTGRVVDEAKLLSDMTKDLIATWLRDYEYQTQRQVVVVVVPTLQGLSIAEYGGGIGRSWGIGKKDAILVVAPAEGEAWIEVGRGLEDQLPGGKRRLIVENEILPAFHGKRYDAGIEYGTVALLRAVGWTGKTVVRPLSAEPTGWPDRYVRTASTAGVVCVVILLVLIFLGGTYLNRRDGGIWRNGGKDGRGGAFGRW